MIKQKNILFIDSRYDSFYGAQKSMISIIKILENHNYNCTVVTTKIGKLKLALEKEGIETVNIELGKSANLIGGQIIGKNIFIKLLISIQIIIYNFKILTQCLKRNIDVIYANDARSVIYVSLATRIFKKKLIFYVRTELNNNLYNRYSLETANYIVEISTKMLSNFTDTFQEKIKSKTRLINTGFHFKSSRSLDLSRSLGNNQKRIVVGLIGSINYRKGTDLFFDAMDKLHLEQNIILKIVGDVSLGSEEFFENIYKKSQKLKHEVVFFGYLNDEDEIYKDIDILVLPSRNEGLPRTIIEAMGRSIPVIATNVGGVSDILINEDIGKLVDSNSVIQLVNAIKEYCSSKELRLKVGENSRQFVTERFSMKSFEKNILELFECSVKKGKYKI